METFIRSKTRTRDMWRNRHRAGPDEKKDTGAGTSNKNKNKNTSRARGSVRMTLFLSNKKQ